MEFSSRGFQRNNARPASAGATTTPGSTPTPDSNGPVHKKAYHKIKSSRIGSVLGAVLFVSIVVLIIAIIFGVSTRSSESSFVSKKEYQAVFLEGGQVYFGKVKSLNDRYINLIDIYYLNVDNQNVQPENSSAQQNLSLVKLGCELHGPRDQMIINRDRVTFWENLKDESRVAKAIKEWQDQNKNGQKCSEQSNTTQQQSTATPQENSATQNSSTGSNGTNNDSSNSATNPQTNGSNSASQSNTNSTQNSTSSQDPTTQQTP